MIRSEKMQEIISYILLMGTIISASLVVLGGAMYLIQFGTDGMQIEVLHAEAFRASMEEIFRLGLSCSATGIIILGLLSLIFTQIIRVALLCSFYTYVRDYKFAWISFFVLSIMIYSLSWHN